MAKFCIDPGHGGSDPGAMNGSRKEKDDVLKLAKKIKPLLEEQGHTVILTRDDGVETVTIDRRCSMANKAGCDYFLSLHRNSAGAKARGIEIWVHSRAMDKTVEQAKGILTRCCAVGGKSRGVKKGAVSYTDYGVNVGTDMPSALLELLFISSAEDNALFDKYLDDYALAIAKGLVAAVGGKWVDKPKAPKTLYRVQTGAFFSKANAEKQAKELREMGYSTVITAEK
ncbi:MAG: N-acetylmuramoyl-L-alanine amidase [Oscillospiraceae bacterium]|jgi:N-acetylmuramoyl-L-alanine amidase|nr:N-acetylmuramoyl-L-alanine amidase [Oscillospiraceae bacterium]